MAGTLAGLTFLVTFWMTVFVFGVGALIAAIPMTWALGVTGRPYYQRVRLALLGTVAGIASFVLIGSVSRALYLSFGVGSAVASTLPLLFQPRRLTVAAFGLLAAGVGAVMEGLALPYYPDVAWVPWVMGTPIFWGAQFAFASAPAQNGDTTEGEMMA